MLEIRVHVSLHPSDLELGFRNVVRRYFRATINAEELWNTSVEVAHEIVGVLTQRFECKVCFLDRGVKVVVFDAAKRKEHAHRWYNVVRKG